MKNDTRVVSATAPGKIILSGEHAAVYGHPAVVFAVNLKSTATVSLAIKKVAKSNDEIPAVFIEKILSIFEDTFHVSTQNIALSLQTELPIQSGMGSSASLAAAAFKALALWFETTLSKEQLFTMVQETEKIFHGTPSGIDASAIVFGGLMSFQKLEGTYKREQIEIKNGIFPTFFLINSGKPVETTKEMVDSVRELVKQDSAAQRALEKIGEINKEIISAIKNNDNAKLFSLLNQNETELEIIKVVGKKAKKSINELHSFGAAAKISGAGGVKNGSGMILAFHPQPQKLKAFLEKEKYHYIQTEILQIIEE